MSKFIWREEHSPSLLHIQLLESQSELSAVVHSDEVSQTRESILFIVVGVPCLFDQIFGM